jgi:glycerol-3-phosphate dehydrogenase (NAD(P)+)
MRRRIGIAGAGAWGRALAHVAGLAGHDVTLWSRGMDARATLKGSDAIILAIPSQALREVACHLADVVGADTCLVIAAKGIERSSGLFMNEVVTDCLPKARPMVISGPSFAADVMKGLPTAVVLAGPTLAEAGEWAESLSVPTFRIYSSDDVRGVEVGGALKNVLAIACGLADGKGLGDSARAALTTRGFAELQRFGRKLGARPETLMGLSGLGDLLLTCASAQSRNYSFGRAIGEGASPPAALTRARGVVEGAHTVKIARTLADQHGIDAPITAAVHAIVDEQVEPDRVIEALLARPARTEF